MKLKVPEEGKRHPVRVGIVRDYPFIETEDEELENIVLALQSEGIEPEIVFDIRYAPTKEPVPDLLIVDFGGMSTMGAHGGALANVKYTLDWLDEHPGRLMLVWTMFTKYLYEEAIEEMEIEERNNVVLIGGIGSDELDEAWAKVRLWLGVGEE